jgi:hypothetical protein
MSEKKEREYGLQPVAPKRVVESKTVTTGKQPIAPQPTKTTPKK